MGHGVEPWSSQINDLYLLDTGSFLAQHYENMTKTSELSVKIIRLSG